MTSMKTSASPNTALFLLELKLRLYQLLTLVPFLAPPPEGLADLDQFMSV